MLKVYRNDAHHSLMILRALWNPEVPQVHLYEYLLSLCHSVLPTEAAWEVFVDVIMLKLCGTAC